jgi:hypothetical protein
MFIQEFSLKAGLSGKVHQAPFEKTMKPDSSQAMK